MIIRMLCHRRILPVFIVFGLLGCLDVFSQNIETESEEKASIIEKIEKESQGNITIDIPDYVSNMLTVDKKTSTKRYVSNPGVNVSVSRGRQGWRIQIFGDGRNQSTLQSRANARARAVTARFPKYRSQVYSFSKAPNWYTRIGNFKTQGEANAALAELKRAFPSFAAEMRVVRSQISVK